MRQALSILFALTLVLAACGSDDADAGDDTSTTVAVVTTEPTVEETTTSAAPATTAATTEVAGDTTTTEAAVGGLVAVELSEWEVDTTTELTAGSVGFDISNTGSFGHEFAVAKGDSYETLPLLESGAVDEAALGADLLGKTEIIAAGDTAEATFDLEPGNYVLFCNIAVGPNSHAALGQTLSVTVG